MVVFKAPYQSMQNAPKDRAILTNEGIVCHVDQRDWGSPVTTGWYLCDTGADILTCADDGMKISRANPHCWMDIPAWK